MSFYSKFIKKNGKLEHTTTARKKLYETYINSLPEGTIIEYYLDVSDGKGSLAQLAKIHAMIKALANHTGYTPDEMKIYVKKEAGMCYFESNNLICKSFGDCSKEELSSVINVIQEIGNRVNFQV